MTWIFILVGFVVVLGWPESIFLTVLGSLILTGLATKLLYRKINILTGVVFLAALTVSFASLSLWFGGSTSAVLIMFWVLIGLSAAQAEKPETKPGT